MLSKLYDPITVQMEVRSVEVRLTLDRVCVYTMQAFFMNQYGLEFDMQVLFTQDVISAVLQCPDHFDGFDDRSQLQCPLGCARKPGFASRSHRFP